MKAKMLLIASLLLPNLLLSGSVILEESFENLRDTKGWHIVKDDVIGDHGVIWKTHKNGLELQRGVVSTSADGNVHAELDAKHNVKISTKVELSEATNYRLNFALKARAKKKDKSTSAMSVKLFGKVVKINANSYGQLLVKNNNENVKVSQLPQENGWIKIEIDYDSVDRRKKTLLFRGIGKDDSYGMLLDNVKLIAKDANDTDETNLLPEGVILKESFENLRDKKGWHILKGSLLGDYGTIWATHKNGLELQRGIVSSSADGTVHAELDAKHNVKISAKVTPTDASEYTLRFAIKARSKKGDKSTSAMRINLFKQIVTIRSNSIGELSIKNKNNNVKVTQTPLNNGWSKVEIHYTNFDKSKNALVIRGIGRDDSYGMLLDDIELRSSGNAKSQFDIGAYPSTTPYRFITLEVNGSSITNLQAINKSIQRDQNRTLVHKGNDNNGTFYIYNIELQKGNNEINITSTSNIQTLSKVITIHSDANQTLPIGIRASKYSDVGQLSTNIEVGTYLDVKEYLLDSDGDGVIDQTNREGNFTINITKEGRYKPRVTIRTENNLLYSTGNYAMSLDVKSSADQKDPINAEPIDVAKEFVEAIINDDRERVERLVGGSQKNIMMIYGHPQAREVLIKAYSNITKWEQTYHPMGDASVKILFDAEGKSYGGGFEMNVISSQLNNGRIWTIGFIY